MRISDWSSDVCSSDLSVASSRDPRLDEREELVEDAVLESDRKRQEAVEPSLDGRHLVLEDAILVDQLETGAMLEFVERGAGELAPRQQVEPAQEGSAGIFALEVVGGVEQPLPARLALAARKRPPPVQSPCDRAGEAQLALAVRGHRPEQRRGCLRSEEHTSELQSLMRIS